MCVYLTSRCLLILSILFLLLLPCEHAGAEPNGVSSGSAHSADALEKNAPRASGHDATVPGRGHFSIAGGTGVPFAGFAEVAVGPTDWLGIGAVGGVADTFDEYGVGGRARLVAYRGGPLELVLSVPVIYYPPVAKRGNESWLLTNPSLVLAGTLSGGSVYGGVGGLLASCTDGLGEFMSEESDDEQMGRGPMVDGIWNTVHAGGALPVGTRTDITLDGSLMLTGFVLSKSYAERIGPPFVALVGARRVF
jgi:hypothetical protein